jgi:hypothetical protein
VLGLRRVSRSRREGRREVKLERTDTSQNQVVVSKGTVMEGRPRKEWRRKARGGLEGGRSCQRLI